MLAPGDADPYEGLDIDRHERQLSRALFSANAPCALEPCYGRDDVFLVWKHSDTPGQNVCFQFHNVITNMSMHAPIAIPGTPPDSTALISAYAQHLENERYFYLWHFTPNADRSIGQRTYKFAFGIVQPGSAPTLHISNFIMQSQTLRPVRVTTGHTDRLFVLGVSSSFIITRYQFAIADGSHVNHMVFTAFNHITNYAMEDVPRPPLFALPTDTLGVICKTRASGAYCCIGAIPVGIRDVRHYNFRMVHANHFKDITAKGLYMRNDVLLYVVLEQDDGTGINEFTFYRCPLPLQTGPHEIKVLGRLSLPPARILSATSAAASASQMQTRIVAWRIVSITNALHYIVARVQHVPRKLLLVRVEVSLIQRTVIPEYNPIDESDQNRNDESNQNWIDISEHTWIDLPAEARTSAEWMEYTGVLHLFALTHSQPPRGPGRLTAVFYIPDSGKIITTNVA